VNDTLVVGRRVRVHVNLHRQQLSVVDPRTGKVIRYVTDVTLVGVEFRFQPACVERVRAKGVRAVCAYALGFVSAFDTNPPEHGRRVVYKPFRHSYFHDHITGERIDRADRVVFVNLRAYAVS
jgi:hypothetical protein